MTSLGFSEYAESNNDSSRTGNGNGNGNGNGKIYNRRNGGGGGGGGSSNRTLKIPRTNDTERGLLQSPNGGTITGISNENGNNGGVIQQAGKKMKQIKDYIESIHRKGGEDSEEDGDGEDSPSILPSYPAQGMGVYATNVSHSGIIRGADTLSSNTPSSAQVVRKTTQMNSLNPTTSYSSTLLEGMADSVGGMISAPPPPSSMYFEKLTGIAGAPKKDGQNGKSEPFSTNAYASQYYEQFVPYAESLANQLAAGAGGGSGSGGSMSGTNAALIEKLNYIIHMLEDKKDEKTGHVVEELVLYCFLGVFIIFIVDTFTRAASGGGGGAGRGSGAGGGGFGMFGGRRSFTSYRR
jgi:hypothetical protein